jgi:hypothetical protein
MLLAILIGGAILALALGLNPLTFQRFTGVPEGTPTAVATSIVVANTPAAGATVAPVGAAAPAAAPTAIPTQVAAAPAAVQTAAPAATPAARPQQPETVASTTAAEPTTQAAEPTAVSNQEAEPTPVQAAVPADLAAAIVQGYDNYWSVRVQASGDPNNPSVDLGSVMAGDELQAANETLAQYREQGVAFSTTVHHQIWITAATANEATVVDRYVGQSVRLNLDSKQPDGSDPVTESYADAFALRNIGGVWKVVRQQPWE